MHKFCFIFFLFFIHCFADELKPPQEEMSLHLNWIKDILQTRYAPLEWKKLHLNFDIEKELEKHLKKISLLQPPFIKNYQKIIKSFLNTFQDHHLHVTFFSTESASLPFNIKTIEEGSFVSEVDSDHWPKDQTVLQVGDQILSFNDLPIKEALKKLKKEIGEKNQPLTQQALADQLLTFRLGELGNDVPQGKVKIVFKNIAQEICQIEIDWSYLPERINRPYLFLLNLFNDINAPSLEKKLYHLLQKIKVSNSFYQLQLKEKKSRKEKIGDLHGPLPPLGEIIWTYPSSQVALEELPHKSGEGSYLEKINWFAYLYKSPHRKKIGYLRIPHYHGAQEEFVSAIPLIAHLEKISDGLVIDQLSNPGGSLLFMHQVLSLLTPYPLQIPKHQVALTQKEVMEAITELDELASFQDFSFNEEILQKKYYHSMVNYYQTLIDEWQKGKNLTDPLYLGGVESVEPFRVHYSKPILMLINELDFSAADFAPAILQDNGRAILMGTNTAGAGGAVSSFSFPNQYGIKEIFLTDTIAVRKGLQKIENLGVFPDIEYRITSEDLKNNYSGYVQAINCVMENLLSFD